MLIFLIFIFGTIVGSFLNVVICRLETGEDIVKKRSHCPHCGQVLLWYDLIPIVSLFILGAKCRACSQKISWQYPIIEITTGALFLLIFNFQFSIFNEFSIGRFSMLNLASLCFTLYVVCSLLVIFAYDFKHYIIPDVVLWPAIGAALIYRIFDAFNPPTSLCARGAEEIKFCAGGLSAFTPLVKGGAGGLYPFVLSAIGAASFFLLIILVTRGRGMGLGDVKLAILMGLILGWPQILLALFLAFFSGATIGVILIMLGRKTMKSQIPFGPFLITGTAIAWFWGPAILDWWRALSFLG